MLPCCHAVEWSQQSIRLRGKRAPVQRILAWVFATAFVLILSIEGAHADSPPPQDRCDAYDPAIAWLEAPYQHFSICYTAAYADDVPWVALWVTHAHTTLARKYGTPELRTVRDATPENRADAYQGGPDGARMHVNVMLLPQPDGNASTGTTRFMHSWGSSEADALYGTITDQVRHAFIPYLTPSAPHWTVADRWGVLQAPTYHFHAKNLMHEYTHAVQHTIRVGETAQRRPWDYLPAWVTEGLAEYEGGAHTTAFYRTTGYQRLLRHVVEEIPDQVVLRSSQGLTGATVATITTTDVYFGGHLIVYWLAAALGEDVHARLVRHQEDTFTAALAAELAAADLTMQEAWDAFAAWVAAEYAALQAPTLDPLPLPG